MGESMSANQKRSGMTPMTVWASSSIQTIWPIASARWSKSSCHTRRLRMAGGGPLAVTEETEKGAPGDGATPSTLKSSGVTSRSGTLTVRSPARTSRMPGDVKAASDGPNASRQLW